MRLSKEAIEEFKQIHKKVSGEEISDQEAYEMASNLLRVSLWVSYMYKHFLTLREQTVYKCLRK